MPVTRNEILGGTAGYLQLENAQGNLGNSLLYQNGSQLTLGTLTPIVNTLFTLKGTTAVAGNFAAKFVNLADVNILSLENDKSAIFGGSIYTDNAQTIYGKNTSLTFEAAIIPRYSDDRMFINYGGVGLDVRNTAGVTKLSIDNAGNVGIGVGYAQVISNKLAIKTANADADGIRLGNTSATNGIGELILVAGGATGFGISNWANSSILENNNTGSLVLGSLNSSIVFQTGGRVANMILKATGTLNITGLQVGNAGLASGDLYVDTAINVLANGDLIVARKV
jgi:hypothetical protein